LIEAIFPDIITEYFKIYFDSVTCAEEFNAEMFTNIIRMKAGCSLKLIHSPEHAEKMKKKIRKCFD
jgi:nickel-dependent lactate racemase